VSARVWITQCLCPGGHCIAAVAGEAEDANDAEKLAAELRSRLGAMLESEEINPWCGLCNAGVETWRCETARTRFRTMEEAKPELERLAAAQRATAAVFGHLQRND